jgi:hypothetical protein
MMIAPGDIGNTFTNHREVRKGGINYRKPEGTTVGVLYLSDINKGTVNKLRLKRSQRNCRYVNR